MSSLRVNDLIFLAKAFHCIETVSLNLGHLAVLTGMGTSEVGYERLLDIEGQLVKEYGAPPEASSQGREMNAAGELVDASGGRSKTNVILHRHAKHGFTAGRVGADFAAPHAEQNGEDAPKEPSREEIMKHAELRAQMPISPKEDPAVPEAREQIQQQQQQGPKEEVVVKEASLVQSIERAMSTSEREDSEHASDHDDNSDEEVPVNAKEMTDGQVLQKRLKMASVVAGEEDDDGAEDEAEASEDEQKEAVTTAHANAASVSAPAMKVPASEVHSQVAQHALQLQDEPIDEDPKQGRAQTPALAAKPSKSAPQRKRATTTTPRATKSAKPKEPNTPAAKPRKSTADRLTSAVPPVTNLSMEPTEPPGSAATKRKRGPVLNEDGTPKEKDHRKGTAAWAVANPIAARSHDQERKAKRDAKQAAEKEAAAPRRKTPIKPNAKAAAAAAQAGESDDADVDEKGPKAKKAKGQSGVRQQPGFEG